MSVTYSEHITGFGLFSDEFSWFPLFISCVWNLITETVLSHSKVQMREMTILGFKVEKSQKYC